MSCRCLIFSRRRRRFYNRTGRINHPLSDADGRLRSNLQHHATLRWMVYRRWTRQRSITACVRLRGTEILLRLVSDQRAPAFWSAWRHNIYGFSGGAACNSFFVMCSYYFTVLHHLGLEEIRCLSVLLYAEPAPVFNSGQVKILVCCWNLCLS